MKLDYNWTKVSTIAHASNEDIEMVEVRARPGFEPGTSRILSEYHYPRPTSHTTYVHVEYGIVKK